MGKRPSRFLNTIDGRHAGLPAWPGEMNMGMLQRQTLVEQLATKAGWHVAWRVGDCYAMGSPGRHAMRYVEVKHGSDGKFIKFTAMLPIRFSLERPPHGLFGRLLLRSTGLLYSSWLMSIWESCEAQPYLCGQWPVLGMTPKFFDIVCQEMVGEIRGFEQELRDRFNYDMGSATSVAPSGRAIVPHAKAGQGIMWVGD